MTIVHAAPVRCLLPLAPHRQRRRDLDSARSPLARYSGVAVDLRDTLIGYGPAESPALSTSTLFATIALLAASASRRHLPLRPQLAARPTTGLGLARATPASVKPSPLNASWEGRPTTITETLFDLDTDPDGWRPHRSTATTVVSARVTRNFPPRRRSVGAASPARQRFTDDDGDPFLAVGCTIGPTTRLPRGLPARRHRANAAVLATALIVGSVSAAPAGHVLRLVDEPPAPAAAVASRRCRRHHRPRRARRPARGGDRPRPQPPRRIVQRDGRCRPGRGSSARSASLRRQPRAALPHHRPDGGGRGARRPPQRPARAHPAGARRRRQPGAPVRRDGDRPARSSSRIDAGATDLNPEVVDLVDLCDRVSQRYGYGDLPIEVHRRGRREALVDRVRFERILGNLLENATTHGGGPMRITIEPSPVKRLC